MNLLDIAGLAFATAMAVQFTKPFVQLLINGMAPSTQNAVIRVFVYLVSYVVAGDAIASAPGFSLTLTAALNALGPAFSVFLAAITGYQLLTTDTAKTAAVAVLPGFAPIQLPAPLAQSAPAQDPAPPAP